MYSAVVKVFNLIASVRFRYPADERGTVQPLTFPDWWIGRDGPINWPPRSPDISPLDFFLWGYVKDIVYQKTDTGHH